MLTTARLILRPWRVDDLPDLAAMLQDPVAMVAYQGPFSDQEVRAWLDRQLDNYTRHGPLRLQRAVRRPGGGADRPPPFACPGRDP